MIWTLLIQISSNLNQFKWKKIDLWSYLLSQIVCMDILKTRNTVKFSRKNKKRKVRYGKVEQKDE